MTKEIVIRKIDIGYGYLKYLDNGGIVKKKSCCCFTR